MKTSLNNLRTLHPFKPFRGYPKSASILKEGNLCFELKSGGRTRIQTEMVEFMALPFPSQKTLNIWSFQVVVVQQQQRNVQTSVIVVC